MAHLAQSSKRRRLDQAASTLSKPFKSPLRTPVQKVEQTANPSPLRLSSQINPEGRAETTDETAEHHPKEEIKGTGEAPKRTPTTAPIKAAQQTTPLVSLRKRKPFASSPNSIPSDPAVAALQKQHTVLQARLSSLRAELDTTQQALRIESSPRDEELEALILKWRAASQDAAEELFASARDKVSRMGGVRAWKERAKKSRERWDDREDTLEDWGHDLDEDERERRKTEMLDSLDLNIDSRVERDREKEDEDDEHDEEESFTMDMMLKNMNIDLGTIGFDKVNQRWIKD